MEVNFTCFSAIAGGQIDRVNGIIRGVSVITEGVAKGHGFEIDGTSISTLHSLAVGSDFKNGVLVKFRHADKGEHQDVISETAGALTNFRVEGNKEKADLILLSALPQAKKDLIFELAEKFANQFGFSPVGNVQLEEKDGKKYARFTSLKSVDLTDEPAANSSLFSMGTCEFCGKSGCMSEHDETELSAAHEKASAEHKLSIEKYAAKHGKKLSHKHSMSAITPEAFADLQATIADLKAKLSAVPAPAPVTAIQFTGADGKAVSLSAQEIFTKLATAERVALEATAAKEGAQRTVLLSTMKSEGRVAINPVSKVAYTLAELQALPLEKLEFIAANSQRIPLQAKAVFNGNESKKTVIPEKATAADRISLSLKDLFGGAESAQEITAALSRGAVN